MKCLLVNFLCILSMDLLWLHGDATEVPCCENGVQVTIQHKRAVLTASSLAVINLKCRVQDKRGQKLMNR